MGLYYYALNHTKREVLSPHDLGEGAKAFEIVEGRFKNVLIALLAPPSGLNDIDGRWHGDAVSIEDDAEHTSLHYSEDPTWTSIGGVAGTWVAEEADFSPWLPTLEA